ncbi:MAG: hypothetical protein FWD33_01145 [Alphaproteobacteria bacterium]|nr:hypothetical protein [Alphaproteobacteria bacterium]
MSVQQYNVGNHTLILMPGSYKLIAIGPGGDGARGGTSLPNGTNQSTSGVINGARGGGGGAAGKVWIEEFNLASPIALAVIVDTSETKIFSSMVPIDVTLDKAGSGSNVGGVDDSVPVPGSSVGVAPVSGSRGGGAGGTRGSRGTGGPVDVPSQGGAGDYGNGADAVLGVLTGEHRTGGNGAAGGGGNPVTNPGGAGDGGKGAEENGLVVDDNTTLAEVAAAINGGSGGNGTAPSIRPAQTGMLGGNGGGGGGAWTSGAKGGTSGSPSAGVNGIGGPGGAGGVGTFWVITR